MMEEEKICLSQHHLDSEKVNWTDNYSYETKQLVYGESSFKITLKL